MGQTNGTPKVLNFQATPYDKNCRWHLSEILLWKIIDILKACPIVSIVHLSKALVL